MRRKQTTMEPDGVRGARGGMLRLLALPLTLLAFLVFSATPALAADAHPFITSFGSFEANFGVTVDEVNGNVFATYGGNNAAKNAVRIFGPEGGTPAGGVVTTEIPGFDFRFFPATLAVDNSATSPSKGALYVADAGRPKVDKYVLNAAKEYEYVCQINGKGSGCTKEGGAAEISFGGPGKVGVDSRSPYQLTLDPKGNLFVADELSSAVYELGPGGEDLATIPIELGQGTPEAVAVNPEAVAVNSDGDLFFYVRFNEEPLKSGVYEYKANSAGKIDPGTEPTKFSPGGEKAIAIDPGNDHVYVADGNHVSEYDSAGALVTEFGKEVLANIKGIAVNSQSGDVYVSGNGGIFHFGPLVVVPDASTEAASEVARTSATLNAHVGAAGGPDATCLFQYAEEAAFKANRFKGAPTAPCSPAGPFSGTGLTKVEAKLSGLTAGTTYHYRVLASNENGANENVNELSFSTPAAVSLKSEIASAVTPTAATLNGTITPAGDEVEECGFEYLDDASFEASLKAIPAKEGFAGATLIPCAETPAQIGTGADPVAVHADVSGLSAGVVYHFRLTAKNAFGTTKGAGLLLGPPRIDAASVSQITSTSALIAGLVNPDGVATTYLVQYVSEADFDASEWAKATNVPVGGEAIGAGIEALKVAQQLSGLAPLTTYHLRIVADNASGTAATAGRIFTTYGELGAGLPDARAYEQVSPVDKNGSAPRGQPNQVQAASDGNGIVYLSGGGIPGGEGSQAFPLYLASRGADWSTQGLLPPASGGATAYVLGWSEDLSKAYVDQGAFPGAPVAFFQRDSATHSLRPIAAGGKDKESFSYVGAAADGSVVVFESTASLAPGAATGTNAFNTYAWVPASGELILAGSLNDEQAPAEGTFAGAGAANDRRSLLQAQHALSADGSRLFFNDAGGGHIYLRQNPAQPQSALDGEGHCTEPSLACTLEASASHRTTPDPKGPKPAVFMSATPDGSQAFFTSAAKLTNDATTGPQDKGNDLYRFDSESGELIDLVHDAKDANGAEVQGVLGTSDDGSYVYFAANGVLTSTPNERGEEAQPGNCSQAAPTVGACSLYLWHEGTVTFIARLQAQSGQFLSDSANWRAEHTSRVSADGRALLFGSVRALSDYDNEGVPELYRYEDEAAGEDLRCVSCNPTGAPPLSAPQLSSINKFAGNQPTPARVLTRNLSADGSRVFFETPDKLVAADTNGEGGCPFLNEETKKGYSCQDVYEWEAEGSGTCHSARQNGGCLYLLSDGTGTQPAYFADASPDGGDVFFFTDTALVGQDRDQIPDIYDARVGGGIPSQNPPPAPPACPSAEACRSVPAPAPMAPSPGSAAFSGPGNQKPAHHKKKTKKKKHGKKHSHKKRHAVGKHG